MDVMGSLLGGAAMIVGVFVVGVVIQVLFDRRFGTGRVRSAHADPGAQAHQQAVRSQLGGFGSGSGPQG